jgi:hypothetical protein
MYHMKTERPQSDATTEDESNRRDEQLQKELEDFEIGKTQETFFETGKQLGTALLTYLLLLCLTTLLVFGNVVPNTSTEPTAVKIPFLELSVAKPYAAWIILILSDMALYWFFSTAAYELVLAAKLYELMDARYKTGWYTNMHLRYPSVFSASFLITHYLPRRLGGFLSYTMSFLAIGGGFIFHVFLTWKVSDGVAAALGITDWRMSLIVVVSLLPLMPVAMAIYASQSIRLSSNTNILRKMILPEPDRRKWKGEGQ